MTLIKKSLRKVATTIYCEERFSLVKVLNCLFINVYFPCVGSPDRLSLSKDINDNNINMTQYHDYDCLICGDFNVNFDGSDPVGSCVTSFMNDCSFTRCDDLFPSQKVNTYVNQFLNQKSCIDYILVSKGCSVKNFAVLDPDINISDHLPLLVEFSMSHSLECRPMSDECSVDSRSTLKSQQAQLRWDKACSDSYYCYTGQHLHYLVLWTV